MPAEEITNYMRLALEQAFFSIGISRPNPAVGAVVVKDGIVVGKGRTQRPGSAHAEVMALRDAGELARGAAIFVTLEPCCHYGRTPPCTKAIIDAGIKEVYFAHADPNPVVRGNSCKVLEEAGIVVHEGVEACIAASVAECDDVAGSGCRVFGYASGAPVNVPPVKNAPGGAPSEMEIEGRAVFAEIERFFEAYDYFVKNKRTFVEVKCAMTENRFMAGIGADGAKFPVKITGQGADCWNHELRAMSDAVLVGAGTLLADNPSLDVRFAAGNNPVKVLWAGHHAFSEDVCGLKFFAAPAAQVNAPDAGQDNALIALVYSFVEQKALESLSGVEVVRLTSGDFAGAWSEMLDDMSRRGMHRLMVEPGATLARLLFEGDNAPDGRPLWNRLDLWQSTNPQAESFLDDDTEKSGVPCPELPQDVVAAESAMLGPDVLTVYYPC